MDTRLGKWMSVDPLSSKYPFVSPYTYVVNNPINATDPDGKDVYLIVWATDGGAGHAAIAVDNYKTVETTVMENGKAVTKIEYVKDGTLTYYDFGPIPTVDGWTAFKDVPGTFQMRKTTVNGVLTEDSYGSPGGHIPDGVVQITTDHNTDIRAVAALKAFQMMGSEYNGMDRNCSDFAQRAVEQAAQKPEGFTPTEELFNVFTITTPNKLFRETQKLAQNLPNVKVIKRPGDEIYNLFRQGVKAAAPTTTTPTTTDPTTTTPTTTTTNTEE